MRDAGEVPCCDHLSARPRPVEQVPEGTLHLAAAVGSDSVDTSRQGGSSPAPSETPTTSSKPNSA